MKDIDFSQFQGIWDAKRVIMACNYFATDFIITNCDRKESNSDNFKYKRLESALTAFGCDVKFELQSCPLFTEKAQCELKKLISNCKNNLIYVFDNMRLEAFVNKEVFSDYHRNKVLLQLLDFYWRINASTNVWRCSMGWNTTIEITKMIYEKELDNSNTALRDIMAILLLGDNFDKVYSEEELIKNYDYPTITDKELQDIEYKETNI